MSDVQQPSEIRVGVEVSKTTLTGVCIDPSGEITGHQTAVVDFAEASSTQLVAFIAGLKGIFGRFDRVGVAVPGLVASGGRIVAYSAHIPEHSGMDLAAEIETAMGTQAVIENDANAAAFGEYHLGAGRGSHSMFYTTLGAGVGGAVILDGKIWRGVAGFAGEFGFIPVDEEFARLEDYASGPSIIRRTRSRVRQDATSSLVDIDQSQLSITDIVEAAAKGDDFAKLMLERTGKSVGTALANVINLLNIDRIVIGGEIMSAGQVILDAISNRARKMSFGPSFEATEIMAGELGPQAGAAGAALIAHDAS